MSQQRLVFEDAGLSKAERKALRTLSRPTPNSTAATKEERADNALPLVGPTPPALGEFWSSPLARPSHRATGFQLAAAYPFAAADMFDPAGPVMGLELRSGGRAFTLDPWTLYQRGLVSSPNMLVQGSLRRGKSFFVKRLICLLSLFDRYAINTSDSKGEHGVVAEAIGGDRIKVGGYGSDTRLNPLERGTRHAGAIDREYEAMVLNMRRMVMQSIASLLTPGGRALTSREVVALDWALDEAIRVTNDSPTVRNVWDALSERDLPKASGGLLKSGDTDALTDGLRRLIHGDLEGMFDGESTVKLNVTSPYTVIDTEAMAQRGDLALAVTQTVTNAWVQGTIADKHSGRRYFVIREEGWRDMNTLAALQAHQLQLKLSGEYGITMVMIVHEDGDFDAVGAEGSRERELARTILRGYANVVSFQQPRRTLINAVKAGVFTEPEAATIGGLSRGQFMFKTHTNSYVVDGRPTTTDWEKDIFNTDGAMNK